MKNTIKFDKKQIFRLALILFIAIGIYGILPQIRGFKGSMFLLKHTYNSDDSILAFLFSMATYISASFVYCSLAIKPLKVVKTAIMQLSAMFINRLLPAGIGALGMNAAYLRKEKHTLTESGVIVGLNNIIGLIGHGLLLGIIYLFFKDDILFRPNLSSKVKTYLVVLLGVLLLAGIIFLKRQSKKRVQDFKKQLRQISKYYGNKPWRLVFALLAAMSLTMCFTLCLWFCTRAMYIQISIPAALILLTIGVGAGTAVPLPGGLGGVEAGIYAGLVSGMHIASQPALAAVLLFRLVSYWIPLLIGFFAFLYTQNKGMFTFGSAQSGSQQKQ